MSNKTKNYVSVLTYIIFRNSQSELVLPSL